jgi:hypothetical protein
MVKYQNMLCKNLYVQLDVVKTLSPATLLQVNSGPLEHDCLGIMDEVFSSQPVLINCPLVIRTLHTSWMATALSEKMHILLDMQ